MIGEKTVAVWDAKELLCKTKVKLFCTKSSAKKSQHAIVCKSLGALWVHVSTCSL